MKAFLNDFAMSEDGAVAVENALLVALIAVAVIPSATTLGNTINDIFSDVADWLFTK